MHCSYTVFCHVWLPALLTDQEPCWKQVFSLEHMVLSLIFTVLFHGFPTVSAFSRTCTCKNVSWIAMMSECCKMYLFDYKSKSKRLSKFAECNANFIQFAHKTSCNCDVCPKNFWICPSADNVNLRDVCLIFFILIITQHLLTLDTWRPLICISDSFDEANIYKISLTNWFGFNMMHAIEEDRMIELYRFAGIINRYWPIAYPYWRFLLVTAQCTMLYNVIQMLSGLHFSLTLSQAHLREFKTQNTLTIYLCSFG